MVCLQRGMRIVSRKAPRNLAEVEKVELARNMPAAKRKDFGFVTFNTHEAAVACAEDINNAELGEGENKVKVRARLSRPLQRGRGKMLKEISGHRGAPRGGRSSWSRPMLPPPRFPPPRFSGRGSKLFGSRGALISGRIAKRPIGSRDTFRDRWHVMSVSDRPRRLPPPERFYDRRPPPVPVYPKSSSKRDYRHDDFPSPRSRVASDYVTRVLAERRPSYRDEYSSRETGYSDELPRSNSRNAERRPYADEDYGRKLERPSPTYRERRAREYEACGEITRVMQLFETMPERNFVSSNSVKRACSLIGFLLARI